MRCKVSRTSLIKVSGEAKMRTKIHKLAGIIFSAVYLSLSFIQTAASQESFGRFHGDLIVKALGDGRNLALTHPFSFEDASGTLWSVPVGTVVNGASIPQAFWSIIGGPFEDKYREASVVHDHYCVQKSRPWDKVHRIFYDGMRARGVNSTKAKLMYAAVYNFGPRWLDTIPGEEKKLISGQPIFLNDAKEAILKFVTDNDPSAEEIVEFSNKLAEARTLEQLEKVLYENADCTPILSNAGADVRIGKTLILCGMSTASKRQVAVKNIRLLNAQLRRLLHTQMYFLLPAIDDYVRAPDEAKWHKIRDWSQNVYGLIKLGIASVLKIEERRAEAMAPPIDDVFEILGQRAAMMSPILSGPPKSEREMSEWVSNYRQLVARLERKLDPLEKYLHSISQ